MNSLTPEGGSKVIANRQCHLLTGRFGVIVSRKGSFSPEESCETRGYIRRATLGQPHHDVSDT
jgi:hypothetical protein